MRVILPLATASILALGTAWAEKAPPSNVVSTDRFSGFYVGGGLSHANINATAAIDEEAAGGPYEFKADVGFNTIGAQLLAGYGQALKNNLYFGGELFYQYIPETGGTVNLAGNYATHGFSMRHTFGGLVKAGYLLNNFIMPYVAIGSSVTRFRYSAIDTNTENHNLTTKDTYGLTTGLGLQAMITDNLGLDCRYLYTSYQNTNHMNYTSASGTDSDSTKLFYPRSSLMSINFLYRFG